jgi:hypothetical protein
MKPPVLLSCLLLAMPSGAATRYVALNGGHVPPFTNGWSSAATNIQDAVDVARDGDVVLVSSGRFALATQVVVTNAIALQSAFGAASSVLTGGFPASTNRCLYVTTNAVIDGFTISNGHTASESGGGALCVNGATLCNSEIADNRADGDGFPCGGGVLATAGACVSNCIVRANYAQWDGGGVYCAAGGSVVNCRIINNVASNCGGGVECNAGGAVAACAVLNNQAFSAGGGIGHYLGGLSLNCTVISNSAAIDGGGIMCNGSGTVRNCLVAYNIGSYGAGISCYQGAVVQNCTVVQNVGNDAVLCDKDVTVANAIIYDNVGLNWENIYVSAATRYKHCCTYPEIPGLNDAGGNITNEPLFVNAAAGNYHVQLDSPCIDAGTNLPWMIGATDLDGNPRIVDGRVDIGCYEYIPEPAVWGVLMLFTIYKVRCTIWQKHRRTRGASGT